MYSKYVFACYTHMVYYYHFSLMIFQAIEHPLIEDFQAIFRCHHVVKDAHRAAMSFTGEVPNLTPTTRLWSYRRHLGKCFGTAFHSWMVIFPHGGFPLNGVLGVPPNGWFTMEDPKQKWLIRGYPHGLETSEYLD